MAGNSIRTFEGVIGLCSTCGQPSFAGDYGQEHFHEQWDGVFCPMFPLADAPLQVRWDKRALGSLKATSPDTYPYESVQPKSV